MSLTGHVTGDDRVIERLKTFPNSVRTQLKKRVMRMALALQRYIVTNKLSGQVLKRKTGTLARSIQTKLLEGPGFVYAEVGSRINESNRLVYAAIHEYGGVIPAHEVVAKKGQALRFELKSGVTMFRKSVRIPDVKMPERSYARSSLHEMEAQIRAELVAGLSDAIKERKQS